MQIALVVVAWIVLAFVNAGFVLADHQATFKNDARVAAMFYWSDLRFSLLWSLFFGPIAWFVMTPIMTGLYEHGWQIRRRKA